MGLTLTLFTDDPELARLAQSAGVDRIGVDLETLGKADRQAGRDTWLSSHRLSDARRLAAVVSPNRSFARVNSVHDGTREEVDALLDLGVATLMLPNFEAASQVEAFLRIVDGRATVVPLVERLAATRILPEIASLGAAEVHIGLNDLSIDLGISDRLALLASPLVEELAHTARRVGMRIAIGGVARLDDPTLRIPSDLVVARLAQLGADGALLSRSFLRTNLMAAETTREIAAIRTRFDEWSGASAERLEAARSELALRTSASECVG